MTATILALFARHFLTGFGAVLVAKGLNPTDADTIVGALSIVGGLAWSAYQKYIAHKNAQ